MIVTAAILLSVLLTGCGKTSRDGEKKSVQKSEDDFLDKDAKPDEQKYLLAVKPFFYRRRQPKIRGRLRATLQVCHSADVPRPVQACSAGL